MNKKQFTIWLAGFFEGEGSVWVTGISKKTIHLAVYQKNLKVLRLIRSVLGGKLRNQKYKASAWQKKRTMGFLEWRGVEARELAIRIRPYLVTAKAQKIDKALRSTRTF
jgi:hypothetical protein